jgi:hypothetical protein
MDTWVNVVDVDAHEQHDATCQVILIGRLRASCSAQLCEASLTKKSALLRHSHQTEVIQLNTIQSLDTIKADCEKKCEA